MKSLKERFQLKFNRNKRNIALDKEGYRELFFKTSFYNIPVREKFIVDDSFIVIYSESTIESPVTVPIFLADGVFKMQFELEGYSSFCSSDLDIEIPEQHFNLFFLPKVHGALHYRKSRICVDIMFDKELFEREVSTLIPESSVFLKQLSDNNACKLFEQSPRITMEMLTVIHQILECGLPPNLQATYNRLKIQELLLLTFSKLAIQDGKNQSDLSLAENEKVLQISEWIAKEGIRLISVQEIVDYFGLSQKVINRGFQKYYNCSAAQYIKKVQMESAKKLIKEQGYSINEIAQLMGYSYPQHFSVAFSKYFGYTPKEVKQKSS